MAKRISELPAATAVADVDELELNQTGASRKATRAQLVTGLAPAAHTHSLAEVTDSGALAGKSSVATGDVEDAAIQAAKTYWGNGVVPAPVDGVSALSLDPAVLMYLTNDPSTSVVRIDDPPNGRPVLISNLTGHDIEVQDQGGGAIRSGVPTRSTLVLNRSGSLWQLLTEWSQRLHQHTLGDVTDSGTAASRDVPASGDATASEVVLGNDSRLTDARPPLAHTHDAGDIDSGTLADARIAESSVKQHEAALSITEAQITDLAHDAVALRGVSLDPSVATPSDGDVLVYRSAGDDWLLEPKPAGGSNPALDDVTDVTIGGPADNEVLAFDAGSGEWINQTPAEAGLAEASHTHGLADVTDSGALAAKDSVDTPDLANDAVSLAKMAHGTPDVLLGFDGSGAPAEITAGQGIGVLGTVIEADVASVFGRTGTVIAEAGDYDGLPLDLQDAPLTRAKLRDYSETTTAPAIASGVLTLDLEAGNTFDIVLTEDVTSISIVNAPASGSLGTLTVRFRQDGTGGRTVDLSGFDFGSASPPAMPSTATTGRLWITALTLDGGAVWEAMAGFEKA